MFTKRMKGSLGNWCSLLSVCLMVGLILGLFPQPVKAAPNQWTLVDAMNSTRTGPTATLLNDGCVLVAGGYYGNYSSRSSTEIYDPASGDWMVADGMAAGRRSHAAVKLADGRVMVMGGYSGGTLLSSTEIYDPETDTWTTADSLNQSRASFTATLLPDGRVLVAGGESWRDSAELYDPATDTWTLTDSLATYRRYHAAVLLADGRVMVVGGQSTSGNLNTAETYDPVTETWTTSSGTLATARYNHTATLLTDGRVLAAGGNTGLASAELYDPSNDSWSATSSMAGGRSRHTATLLPDGQVLMAGGYKNGNLSSVEIYDPLTGTFAAADSLNTGRYYHAAVGLAGGRVLVLGGQLSHTNDLNSAELYHHVPSTPTWSVDAPLNAARRDSAVALLADGRLLVSGGSGFGSSHMVEAEVYDPSAADWAPTGSMTIGRVDHSLTLLADGRVLAVGGYNGGYLASAELYDPDTGTWSATGGLSVGRMRHTATLLSDGRVMVAGGENGGSISSVEIYDPHTGTWQAADSMNNSRRLHTTTLLPDGGVLVVGGDWGGAMASCEYYDPSTDTWAWADHLATHRASHSATLLPSGKVLVAGGQGYSGELTSVELYDPGSDTWATVNPMNNAHAQHNALLLADGRVLIAGGRSFSGNITNITESYDPTTNTWETLDNLTYPRTEFVGALLLDGRVLVSGGFNNFGYVNSTELYDPVLTYTDWQRIGNLAAARHNHTATLLNDGRVLLTGGLDASWTAASSAELYLPASGGFNVTSSMSVPRFLHSATLLDDGSVLLAGGMGPTANYLPSAELYHPDTDLFLPTTGNLAAARYQHTATRLVDGSVLIVGGSDAGGRLASAESYDPAAGTFSLTTGSLVTARENHTATWLPDGSVLIAGGVGNSVPYLAQSEIYDPSSDSFSNTTGSMLAGRTEHTATALPDGRVLVVGGRGGSSTPLASAEIYDPDTGSWTATGALNAARYNHAAAALPDGRVLVVGGYNNIDTHLDSAEVYDPATGSWTQLGDLSSARMNLTATTLANGRVLVAGGVDTSSSLKADLFVEGRPYLQSATSPLYLGDPLVLAGGTFRQRPEASGGDNRSSATNYPLVQLMRADNQQTRWMPVDAATPFTDASFTSLPVDDWPAGYARATVFVNGIPSISRMVQVLPPIPGAFGKSAPADGVDDQPLSLTLSWGASAGATKYEYCLDTSDNDACDDTWISTGTETSVELTDLDTLTAYHWQVRAINITGQKEADGGAWWSFETTRYPQAEFSGDPTIGLAPLAVQFTDESLGSPTGWAWYFGDETFEAPWVQQVSNASWSGREGHSSVMLPDGSIVLMGGYSSGYKNDVWRSTDQGETWTEMTASAGWSARSYHTSVCLSDGSIVLMGGIKSGGFPGTRLNDVWLSTDKGATWTLLRSNAEWSDRNSHESIVLPDDSIMVMGGVGSGYQNDVWRSTDGGVTWTQMTGSAGWPSRVNPSVVLLNDNSIVLSGGYTTSGRKNDVWRSTDIGATWTEISASAEWSARDSHTSAVLPDGSIVLMGGDAGSNKNDVWRSTDQGATWTQMTANAGWSARESHTSAVLPDGSIVLMGGDAGSIKNDVWRWETASSYDQNPSHTYTDPGLYPVALQVYNTDGYGNIIKDAYITVQGAPVITSADHETFIAGSDHTFTITTTGYPTPALDYSGTLPSAVTFTDHGDGTATLAGIPEAGTGGDHALTITGSNGVGSDAEQSFTLTVEEAPVADAGSDQTVNRSALVTLDGGGSYDPDGDTPLTYAWTQTGGTTVALSDSTAASPTFTSPADPDTLTFSLTVTDSVSLDSAPDEVVISVENQAPVADAGLDETVERSALVTLDGGSSYDPDGDTPLAYAWTQTGGGTVALSDSTAASPTFTSPADPDTLTFSLTVTDSLSLDSAPDEVVITVGNQAPVADAGQDQTVDRSALVTLDGGSSYDPDGDTPLTYAWTQTGGGTVALSDSKAASPTFTAPADPDTLTFSLTVTDSLSLDSAPDEVVITVGNQAPVADAGPDQAVSTQALVTLDGGDSYDPDGDIPVTYAWTQTGGTTVVLSDPSAASPTFTTPDDPDTLTFSLVVTDSLGLDSEPDVVDVMVGNQAPVANAGPDQTVERSALVTLDGGSSYDPDGDTPLAYTWTQTGGTTVTLSDPTLPNPTFIAPDEATTLTFSLVVTDSFSLASAPDEVMISIEGFQIYIPLISK